jgi:hypothetical protein
MVAIELWGVVEGGMTTPPGGVMADGQKYAHSSYFNIRFGVLEIVRYIRRKEDCHKAAHNTVGEEHKKYIQEKKSPLVPRYILQTYHEI